MSTHIFSEKIIKLNYEINETLKIYNEVLENPILIKTIDRENEDNLLDLNMSCSSGTQLNMYLIKHIIIVYFVYKLIN